MLLLGLLASMAVGLVILVLMAGAAVAVAGLAISSIAALYYSLRRKLSSGAKRDIWLEPAPPPAATAALEVRDIEVEVLPEKER